MAPMVFGRRRSRLSLADYPLRCSNRTALSPVPGCIDARIKLEPDQEHQGAEVKPQHNQHQGADGAIEDIVPAEVLNVRIEAIGRQHREDRSHDRAGSRNRKPVLRDGPK